ncbi:P-loop containing nucleoside triphosphate hydrolase protein [Cryphonectria parasitica EP155]|uniref:P-loop containing nucleoside triphosphate hydrolase protein n=1 Tax=Cryphonectria parasitica (strain ATCC 38755 / EP155) TaxID=660469 RepID=A0A9P5CRL6_CRYP1|nr:P-loop containing nucleoside triphosphate hydrolase protein [Cryphonectria parasitica EP155]KAF3767657.1 P-loop containing nucleoside triphosphate hydrolase protein [Cryphonectria parasitica EP155]
MLQPVLKCLRPASRAAWSSSPRRISQGSLQGLWRSPGPSICCLRGFATQSSLQPVQLRDYQRECIQSVVSALKNGHKRVGISLATGGGKTVIFTHLISHIDPPAERATQTLILAHRRELVEQAARHCISAYPDKTVEIDMANAKASGLADITVASVASLQKDERLQKYNRDNFKLILVDEAHHIVAPGYMKVLRHFGLDKKSADTPNLVGVSATFSRFDGVKLGAAIDEIVYHKDYVDMIDEKWLSGVIFTTVKSTADITQVKKMQGGGDFVASELSKAVNTEQVNDVTVRSWLAKAPERKSTLVFCVDLSHVAGLTAKFRHYGLDARFVTGDTHKIERGEILDAFKRGEFPVLLNCGVFTEGTDIPNIDCVVLARPTRSRNLLVQMIGRGMRLHQGKKDCHIIDMVSSLETGIVTVPTLFGLDPSELINNATVDDMKSTRERQEAEDTRQKQVYDGEALSIPQGLPQKVTFTEYDSVFDLISDTSGERHIYTLTHNSWVQVGPNKYILSSDSGTYLRLEKDSTEDAGSAFWRVIVMRKLSASVKSKSPYATPRELLKATSFADAVHGADKYAGEHFPHYIISRRQGWRNAPPTDGQLKFLNKMRPAEDPLTAADITKGKAADMITKIKHGARGRFSDLQATKRKQVKQQTVWEQEAQRKQREKVTVGPLER